MVVRPASALDLDAIAALWSSVVGDPITGEALRLWDGLALPTDRRLRLLAEEGGHAVALLGLVRTIDSAVCGLRLFVDESARRRGLGSDLLRRARAFAAINGCDALATTVRDPASEAFAIKRGFTVVGRTLVLERSLESAERFDVTTPADTELRVLSELEGNADDAFYVAVRGLGAPVGPRLSRVQFDARILGGKGQYRPLQVVAKSGGRIVGVSCVEQFVGTQTLLHTLTAVESSHRGRGIGKALKRRAMHAARDWGATTLLAHVQPTNAPMLAINRRCGFIERGFEATLLAPA